MNNQQLITKQWNDFPIQFEEVNGQLMANATSMCAAFGKRPVNWLALDSTQRYIKAMEAKSEFLTLVETRQGGSNAGTWIHEKLILKLAQWLSVDFELQCDEWVSELLRTGKVELQPVEQPALPQSYKQALLALVAAEEEKEVMQLQLAQATQQQQQLEATNHKLANVIEWQAEKVEFADSVKASSTDYTLAEAAKILETDFKGLGQNKLAEFLRQRGRFIKGKTEPYQEYVGLGYFTIKVTEFISSNGAKQINKQTLITGKGLEYVRKILKEYWTK